MVCAKIYSWNTVPVRKVYVNMYLQSVDCRLVYVR